MIYTGILSLYTGILSLTAKCNHPENTRPTDILCQMGSQDFDTQLKTKKKGEKICSLSEVLTSHLKEIQIYARAHTQTLTHTHTQTHQ